MSIAILTPTESGADSLTDINANFADLDTTKADLASPTFTGTPVLPTGTTGVTQSASDNSTKLATTAYVDTAVSSFSKINSGTYTGDGTSNRAVAHGLGAAPKYVCTSRNDNAKTYVLYSTDKTKWLAYSEGTTYTTTVADTTNFYLPDNGNNNGVVFYWVAFT